MSGDIPGDLAPDSRRIFEQFVALGLLHGSGSSLEELRAAAAAERALMGEPPAVAAIEEATAAGGEAGVPLRIYWPHGKPERALLWLHGGGWVLGDLDLGDVDCRRLCLETRSLVVAADYRLAPEFPYPAGLEDAYRALRWLGEEIGSGFPQVPLVVGGDSAGGNLAAATSILSRERGGPKIDHQLLLYPVTDDGFATESYQQFGEGYILTCAAMRQFWEWYLADADAADLAAILRVPDLTRLPPATVLIAGCDVLRDEAEAYAGRLRSAGVEVDILRYAGQLHGFWSYSGVSDMTPLVNADILGSMQQTEQRFS